MGETEKESSSEDLFNENKQQVAELSNESDSECGEIFTSSVVKKRFKSMNKTDDQTLSRSLLINISDLNVNLSQRWRIRGRVTYRSNLRQFGQKNRLSLIISFNIQDATDEITVAAFASHAQSVLSQITQGKCYEIDGLIIRTTNERYSTLPNALELRTTCDTNIIEINQLPMIPESYSFLNLNQLDSTPINSVADVKGRITRCYGLTNGITKDKQWTRRNILILQDQNEIRLTLWNHQAEQITSSMVQRGVLLKHVKIKLFRGNKCLETLENTRISTFHCEDDQ